MANKIINPKDLFAEATEDCCSESLLILDKLHILDQEIDPTPIDTTYENSYQEIYDFQQEIVGKALSDFQYTRDCILDGEENLTQLYDELEEYLNRISDQKRNQ